MVQPGGHVEVAEPALACSISWDPPPHRQGHRAEHKLIQLILAPTTGIHMCWVPT